ncbi:monovalent cation:proton antiporter-2 (CPA2) family protein [Melissococcus plutonius]|nr:cation:proton antiporter [Melissococcus plutonius]MBB5178071.1 monovalent cation:proton antiporter-2 (CPA2) family protein [Melissococcus plutonius]BAN14806.1 Na+/H+ antiporter [Melissococcus plutonius]
MDFLADLFLILVCIIIIGVLCKRFDIPRVIGQLLIGVLLGPALLGIIHPTIFFENCSEIGVILLMFIAGMECEVGLLKKQLKPSLLIAILGILFPILVTMPVSLLFHFSWQEAFFLGLLLAATSVSISVEVLRELNVLRTQAGTSILGASIVDDIVVVILLGITTSLFDINSDNKSILSITILEQLCYFIIIFLAIHWIVPYLLKREKKLTIPFSMTIIMLAICFGMSYLADFVGLSSILGAFFAGIAVGQVSLKENSYLEIETIGYTFFIPIFFVNIGLATTFNTLSKNFLFILIMTCLAIITKFLGGSLGGKLSNFSMNESFIVGAGMISRGEMALVIAQIGYTSKLLSEEYYTSMVLVVILTTLIAPFILKYFVKHTKTTK